MIKSNTTIEIETLRLSIQLVPRSLWERNIRHLMTKYEWTKFRKKHLSDRNISCEICGSDPENGKIFLHEDWRYDLTTEPYTARLRSFVTTCWDCHATEHWGLTERATATGEFPAGTVERLIAHWAKVNGVDGGRFAAHRKRAFNEFERLSDVTEWQWDFGPMATWIKEEFGDAPFEGWPQIY